MKTRPLTMERIMNRLKRPMRLKASVSLLVSSSGSLAIERFDAPKLLSSSARNRFRTWSARRNTSYNTSVKV